MSNTTWRRAGVGYLDVSRQTRSSLAEEYLRDGGLTVGEVAYLLGFSEISAFSRAFRAWTGQSPQTFRRSRGRAGCRTASNARLS